MSEYGADAAYDRGDAVCVIGAGMSGLVAVKNLQEHGFDVDCYEKDTALGGAWNVRQRNSPTYANTHLISSRTQTEFPDFPMPDDWPDYPHHSQVLTYLERYADHFGLRDDIWYGSEIERVEKAERGRVDVIVKSTSGSAARRLRYAAVVIANGHNWDPFVPEYPGQQAFRGEIIHSVSYKDSSRFRGKKVLVVGAGNSGCDIASEAVVTAAKCWHSTRRGYWYVPKYLLGRPSDQLSQRLSWLPLGLRRKVNEYLVKKVGGDPVRFGLPAPDHRLHQSHPIINSHILHHLGHGSLLPKPDISHFDGRSVVFSDGSSVEPDIVVMATGYRPRYDFCDPELLGGNRYDDGMYPSLYAQMFSPASETLFVAGLLQADAGIFPLVHWQTVTIAKWLRTRAADPERAKEFRNQVMAESGDETAATMTDSPRHRLEVSRDRYLRSLARIINTLDKESDGA